MRQITMYTDGSWKNSKHTGGWSCLLVSWPYWKVISDCCPNTTISRMELTAVIKGLECLTEPCEVKIISDSVYTVNCINKWLYNWILNGWKSSTGGAVANQDLLMRIYQFSTVHRISAHWIKSHTNRVGVDYRGNAVVDCYAQMGSDGKYKLF